MSENQKRTVDIIGTSDIPVPGPDGKTVIERWVTYRFGVLPPGTVRILKSEYSDKKVAELIKADVQRRIDQKPKTLEI